MRQETFTFQSDPIAVPAVLRCTACALALQKVHVRNPSNEFSDCSVHLISTACWVRFSFSYTWGSSKLIVEHNLPSWLWLENQLLGTQQPFVYTHGPHSRDIHAFSQKQHRWLRVVPVGDSTFRLTATMKSCYSKKLGIGLPEFKRKHSILEHKLRGVAPLESQKISCLRGQEGTNALVARSMPSEFKMRSCMYINLHGARALLCGDNYRGHKAEKHP